MQSLTGWLARNFSASSVFGRGANAVFLDFRVFFVDLGMFAKNTLILLSFLLFTGCAKTIERIQERKVLDAMTQGQWHLTSFIKAGNDITGDFAPYLFQFHENNTVEAIKNGNVQNRGSWEADVNGRSMISNFPGASTPISLLNGTWKITNNSWTFVEASQTVNNELLTLRLEK